jgi:hypothetical protein
MVKTAACAALASETVQRRTTNPSERIDIK